MSPFYWPEYMEKMPFQKEKKNMAVVFFPPPLFNLFSSSLSWLLFAFFLFYFFFLPPYFPDFNPMLLLLFHLIKKILLYSLYTDFQRLHVVLLLVILLFIYARCYWCVLICCVNYSVFSTPDIVPSLSHCWSFIARLYFHLFTAQSL